MLQAMLASAGLTTDDVEIVEYPDFTQEAAVEQGAVDAATGFANNEPIQLEQHGQKAVVLHVDDITPLPGPGLIASTKTLDAKHDAIAAFVAATLQAMNEIKADPDGRPRCGDRGRARARDVARDAGRDPRRDDRLVDGRRSRSITGSAPSTATAGRRRSRS